MLVLKNEYLFFDELELYNRSDFRLEEGKRSPQLRDDLYQIWTPFIMDSQMANWIDEKKGIKTNEKRQRNRKRKCALKAIVVSEFLKENSRHVQKIYEMFRNQFALPPEFNQMDETKLRSGNQLARQCVKMAPACPPNRTNSLNLKAIELKKSSKISAQSENEECSVLYTNHEDRCVLADSIIFPAKSSVLLGDVSNVQCLIDQHPGGFDFILIDPPWPNRTVKRQKTYEMFDNSVYSHGNNSLDQLSELPIYRLLSRNGILCIWLSNSETAHKMGQRLLEKWKMHKIGQWHWLKICKFGDPVCAFRPEHKVPFETFLIACKDGETERSNVASIPNNFCLISVPNACPSRKPPISLLLHRLGFIPEVQNGLELYARFMLPNFTSVGFEATKFQHQYYFR